MKNLKENFKKHWKLSLIICVLICVLGAGIWFASNFLGRDASSETYVVEVTDEKGKSVKEVYLVLCAEDGTELSWLPYVTNMSGKAQFSEAIEEGTYVKVVGVPFGYKLDESVKYTFDEEGKVKIVLIEDQSVYVAKIGDTMYGSLASALGVANSSSEDVVVELLADTMLKTFTINNNYGKNITLKGNGHTITAEGGNNTFIINQKEGVVAFEGLVLKHKNTGSAFHLNSVASVDLTDVEIDATGGNAYNYALINTLGVDGTTTLNLTRVNAKMVVGSPAKANEAGIIRTGNTSGTKTVNINMVDCNFDTTGATGRHGIVVMKNTVANLDIKNSIIRAGDAYAIWAAEQTKAQTMIATNCQFLAETSPYSAAPIKGYAARIGNTYHLTLDHAAKAASESRKDVTITVVADITMKTCNIKNTKGATITIDGAGRTITTSGGNNAFVVGNNVAFKNLTIDHRNTGSAIHVTSAGDVKATDVYIKATEGKTYSYSLVNVLAEGKSTLDFTRVKVNMAVESKGDTNASVIRTGNSTEAKEVVINLTDCNFDTTKATGRTGITVTKNADTTVNLKNTTIKTMDTFAIRSNEEDINWNNADTKLTSLKEEYQVYPVEGYLAKIGDVFYTFAQAVDVANAAKADTEIKMVSDYTIKSYTINNAEGKLVTLNGDGKKLTTSGGSNALIVEGGKFLLKNFVINHKNTGSVVQIAKVANVELENVEVSATEGKAYDWALFNIPATGEGTTLKMKDVNATMAVAGRGKSRDSAIIRTGNDDVKKDGKVTEDHSKNVKIELTNCNFDTIKATDRSGIVVMNSTIADIKLTNTTITTLDVAPIKAKAVLEGNKITMDDKTVLDSKTTEFNKDNAPIKGYQAKVGNVAYGPLKTALSEAKAGETVTLLQNISSGWRTISKSVVLDGNGYTITSTENGTTDTNDKKLFVIKEAATDVTFKNMDIVYRRSGSMIEVESQANIKLENVNVDATQSENGYEYALINLKGVDSEKLNKISLTMDHVDVKMATDIAAKAKEAGIIRTGNEVKYGGTEKDISIVLNDCTFDTTEAAGRHGIAVVKDTVAKIELNNTKIKTNNVSPIKTYETKDGQITVTNEEEALIVRGGEGVKFDGYAYKLADTWYVASTSDVFEVAKTATEDVTIPMTSDLEYDLSTLKNVNGNKISIDTNGYTLTATGENANVTVICEAKVGNQYTTLADAISVANAATTATTIDLMSDVEVKEYTINKSMTINGNDYVITTKDGNNAFLVNGEYEFTLNNLDIVHQNYGAVVQWAENKASGATVTLKDVKVDAKQPGTDGYKYALFNILAYNDADKVSKLNFEDVEVTMQVASAGGDQWTSIIRTGNSKGATKTYAKTIEINLKNSKLDASKAIGRYGIIVQNTSNTTITLDNSTISTLDVNAVRCRNEVDGLLQLQNNSAVQSANADAVTGYVMKIGNTWYVSQDDIWEAAKTATEDVTLVLSSDKTLNFDEFTNANGKTITIDTDGYTLTAEGAKTAEEAKVVVLCEAKIGNTYTTFANAFSTANAATSPATIELMSDVEVKSYTVNKNMTINGNGFTMTTKGANDPGDAFLVKGEGRQFTLNDLNIVHQNHGAVVKWDEKTAWGADVTLKNVNIDATQPSSKGYEYALFNILPWSNETDKASLLSQLTLENVDVTMKVESKGKDDWMAIIRTGNSKGNSANSHAKTIKITLKDSNLDTTEALGRYGIVIQNTSKTEVIMDNSTIKAGNVNAIIIRDNKGLNENGTVTLLNNSKVTSVEANAFEGFSYNYNDVWYLKRPSDKPVILSEDQTMTYTEMAGLTVNTNGYCLTATGTDDGSATINSEAKMTGAEGTLYLTLQEALAKAEVAKENVTITARDNCEVDVTGISNVNGHTITVDTGEYSVTVKGSLGQNVVIGEVYVAGNVYMNMEKALASQLTVFMYRDLEEDLSAGAASTFTLKTNGYKLTTGTLGTNVSVDSEASVPAGTDTTTYATLKDAIAVANTATSDVTVTVRKAITANEGFAIGSQARNATAAKITINGGNNAITPAAGVGALFTVNHAGDVTFEDVKIEAGNVSGCKGIVIANGGKITLDNPTITTKDALGVDNQSATALVKRLRNENGSIGTITSNINYKVGDVAYTDYSEALNAALTATQDVTIEIWSDVSGKYSTDDLKNIKIANGVVTIDGNSCAMVMNSQSKNAFDIESATVIKDVVLEYSGAQAAIRANAAADIELLNTDIYASTDDRKNYLNPGIINLLAKGTYSLTLTDSEIYAYIPAYDSSLGVIYTGNKGDEKTLTITLNNSKIDATQADGRIGILLTGNTSGHTTATVVLNNSIVESTNIVRATTSAVKGTAIYEQDVKNSTIVLNGTSYVKTTRHNGAELLGRDATNFAAANYSDNSVTTFSVEKEEATTKTLTIEVPIDLYEKLVEWIKKFEFFDKLNIQW